MSPAKLTMIEVHAQQFECLLDYARERTEELAGEDPVLVAMYWGRQCGITPRAIARALELPNSTSIRQEIRRFGQRIADSPKLKHLLVPP
jgi:hypothetical protein